MKKIKVSISLMAVFALLSMNVAFATTLSDVDETVMYQTGIEFLVGKGIVSGYADGTFKPEKTLNRAEMLKILVEAVTDASGLDNDTSCFDDVPGSQWFTKYVCYAKNEGWVKGYDGGKNFKPAQEVTFVEGLKMTLEAFDIAYDETPDVWYKGAVNAASGKNYIPFDIANFSGGLKRGQMADMASRILNDKEGTLETYLGARKSSTPTYATIEEGKNLTHSYFGADAELWGDSGDDEAPSSSNDDGSSNTYQADEITYDGNGFSPQVYNALYGETVFFLNNSTSLMQPASDPHPGHEGYPGSDSSRCGEGWSQSLFDSCEGLDFGERFNFTFLERGTWTYHNHLNPSQKGTIVVQ